MAVQPGAVFRFSEISVAESERRAEGMSVPGMNPTPNQPTNHMLDRNSIANAKGGKPVNVLASEAADRNAERLTYKGRLNLGDRLLAAEAVGREPWDRDQSATRGEWAEVLDQLDMMTDFGKTAGQMRRARGLRGRLSLGLGIR